MISQWHTRRFISYRVMWWCHVEPVDEEDADVFSRRQSMFSTFSLFPHSRADIRGERASDFASEVRTSRESAVNQPLFPSKYDIRPPDERKLTNQRPRIKADLSKSTKVARANIVILFNMNAPTHERAHVPNVHLQARSNQYTRTQKMQKWARTR